MESRAPGPPGKFEVFGKGSHDTGDIRNSLTHSGAGGRGHNGLCTKMLTLLHVNCNEIISDKQQGKKDSLILMLTVLTPHLPSLPSLHTQTREFGNCPVVQWLGSAPRVRVQSLVWDLRSCKLSGQINKYVNFSSSLPIFKLSQSGRVAIYNRTNKMGKVTFS